MRYLLDVILAILVESDGGTRPWVPGGVDFPTLSNQMGGVATRTHDLGPPPKTMVSSRLLST